MGLAGAPFLHSKKYRHALFLREAWFLHRRRPSLIVGCCICNCYAFYVSMIALVRRALQQPSRTVQFLS